MGNIEVYDRGRYFIVTGQYLAGTPTTIEVRQDALNALLAEIFEPMALAMPPSVPKLRRAASETKPSSRRALRATNRQKFKQLWAGDTSGYASDSEADAALCELLAYGAHVTLSSSTGSFASPASIGPNGMSGGGPTVPRMARSPWSARSHGSHRAPQHRRPGRRQSTLSDAEALAPAPKLIRCPYSPKVLGALALSNAAIRRRGHGTKAALKQAGVSMRDLTGRPQALPCAPHPPPGPAREAPARVAW